MKIKSTRPVRNFSGTFSRFFKNNKFDVFCRLVLLLNVAVAGGIVYLSITHAWVIKEQLAKFDKTFGIYDLANIGSMIQQRFQGLWVKPETVEINIKHIDFQQLEFQRFNALNGKKDFSYVPAWIAYNGEEIKVRLRLKGDRKYLYNSSYMNYVFKATFK